MNQAQLAMEAGCSIQSIHNIEQGPGPKRSRVLEQVEAVLAQKEAEL
jgi:DNA-binding XRE family transcriptional regulator